MGSRIWWLAVVCAFAVGCPDGGIIVDDDDDDTAMPDDDTGADDDTSGDDDTAMPDDDTGDDDTAEEPIIHPPPNARIFIMFAYPAVLEAASVDAYLAVAGGSFNGTYWTWSDGSRHYEIQMYEEESGFIEGVQTPGSIVVYAGHSNYGLGATFSDLENHSDIEHVETVDDLFNIGTELVAINPTYLIEEQKYPNFVLDADDIAVDPANYVVPYIHEERFPNDQGVAPGDTFSPIGTDAYGYPIHYYDANTGGARTIVVNGQSEVPQNLQYEALFFRSCSSSGYYIENFDHGVFFYSTAEVDYSAAIVYRFIKGIIEGESWNAIRDTLNGVDPIYGFFDFNAYPSPLAGSGGQCSWGISADRPGRTER